MCSKLHGYNHRKYYTMKLALHQRLTMLYHPCLSLNSFHNISAAGFCLHQVITNVVLVDVKCTIGAGKLFSVSMVTITMFFTQSFLLFSVLLLYHV